MNYSYSIIEPNENFCDSSKKNTDVHIRVIYDPFFRSEFETGIIIYKNYKKLYGIGYEVTMYECNYVTYRITVNENIARQVYEILPLVTFIFYQKRTALIHAAGIKIGDYGFLCIGPSGSGKTTISNMAYNDGIEILSDELIIYDIDNNRIWGTMISSENYTGELALECSALLEKILILNKSKNWDISYQEKSILWIIETFKSFKLNQVAVESIKKIYSQVNFFNLFFNKEHFRRDIIDSNA